MLIFAELGKYEPCKMYSIGHFLLLLITLLLIKVFLHFTIKKSSSEIKKIVQKTTIFLWILEITKIVFNLFLGDSKNPNSFIPLYYCSLILYAGLFSGFCNGTLKKVGDIFLATGGIIGGICFLLCPNTSLTNYPVFHFISIQSFILHGSMLYIGLLFNLSNYVDYTISDIKYYSILIIIIGCIAYAFNLLFDTNLMFISKNFPNTPVEIIYNFAGNLFPAVMILIQATLPFLIINKIKTINTQKELSISVPLFR